jgi:hypothetical protein
MVGSDGGAPNGSCDGCCNEPYADASETGIPYGFGVTGVATEYGFGVVAGAPYKLDDIVD